MPRLSDHSDDSALTQAPIYSIGSNQFQDSVASPSLVAAHHNLSLRQPAFLGGEYCPADYSAHFRSGEKLVDPTISGLPFFPTAYTTTSLPPSSSFNSQGIIVQSQQLLSEPSVYASAAHYPAHNNSFYDSTNSPDSTGNSSNP